MSDYRNAAGAVAPSTTLRPVLADRLVGLFASSVQRHHKLLVDALLVLTGAALTGLLAQVAVPLWPVPITGQTLGVMLAGAMLGMRRAGASLTTYMVLGLLGVPWFTAFGGGMAYFFKPTFGYIIGFIPSAMVIGYLAERRWDRRPVLSLIAFGLSSITPYLFGLPWLWVVMNSLGKTLSFSSLIAVGFTPFIVGGIIKWMLGSMIVLGGWKLLDMKGANLVGER